MATVIENVKNDKVYSIRVQVRQKDAHTGKPRDFVHTYPVEQNLSKHKLEAYKRQVTVEWETECAEALKNGRNPNERYIKKENSELKENISLVDYAQNYWLPIIKTHYSINYYERGLDTIKVLKEYFDCKPIKEISKADIQYFFDKLKNKEIQRPRARAKKAITIKMLKKVCSLRNYEKNGGLTRTTTYNIRKGNTVEISTAKQFCFDYGLNYEEYFETFDTEVRHYCKDTILGYKRILVTILNFALDREVIDVNPMPAKIKIDNLTKAEKENRLDEDMVYDTDEVKKILGLLDDFAEQDSLNRFANWRIKFAVEIPLLLGLRLGEVCGLRWQDISFDKKDIYITNNRQYYRHERATEAKKPKTKSSIRHISISKKLLLDLIEFRNLWEEQKNLLGCIWEDTDEYILTSLVGKPISKEVPYHWFIEFVKKYNLKRISYHQLRHTHATQLIGAGADIQTVAQRLGHKDASVTLKVYSHFLKKADSAATEKLDEVLGYSGNE